MACSSWEASSPVTSRVDKPRAPAVYNCRAPVRGSALASSGAGGAAAPYKVNEKLAEAYPWLIIRMCIRHLLGHGAPSLSGARWEGRLRTRRPNSPSMRRKLGRAAAALGTFAPHG